MIERAWICDLRHGLHARPASMLADAVRGLEAVVEVVNGVSGATADARSVLSVIALDIQRGTACVVRADGTHSQDAVAAIDQLIASRFGEAEQAEFEEGAEETPGRLTPAGLRMLGAVVVSGIPAVGGIGVGRAVEVERMALGPEAEDGQVGTADQERARLREAVRAVGASLEATLTRQSMAFGPGAAPSALVRAHLAMLNDPALEQGIQERIAAGSSAARAVREAGAAVIAQLRRAQSAYIRDRAVDVEDVCGQIMERLLGRAVTGGEVALAGPSVVIADALTPSRLLGMRREHLRGLILGSIGATSHTVILARTFGVPTVIGVANVSSVAEPGEQVLVDGGRGAVIARPGDQVHRYYQIERGGAARRRERLLPVALGPGRTRDETRLEVGVNLTGTEDGRGAFELGAEGVGLLRTEALFMERSEAPSEDEQLEAYTRIVKAAAGRPVIIRTFDVGGDKAWPYLRLAREANPFLGVRGVRVYFRYPELLGTQLRAIARASALGPVRVMAPMVATVNEAAWFRVQVRSAQLDLKVRQVAFDRGMQVGAMLEVPSACMGIEQSARWCDFYSVGTNDLSQYFSAADRGNVAVAEIANVLEPSFLRLLARIVERVRAARRWVGVCGDMASDVRGLPLLVGLGFDEISITPGELLTIKPALARLEAKACRELVGAAMERNSAAEVGLLLEGFRTRNAGARIIEDSLVLLGVDARSKVEAIKHLVGIMHGAGRTDDPGAVEDAMWAREETYSTGVGSGFAIPHCRTSAVNAPTIAVARFARPIEWDARDQQPVEVAIGLCIPEASGEAGAGGAGAEQTHLRILATLARRLMDEGFRSRIIGAERPGELADLVRREIGLDGAVTA